MSTRVPLTKILFDANVWNYLADHSTPRELALSKNKNARILVAPSVVYESLRVRSAEDLRRRAELLTHPDWKRLMPEAYSESAELLSEIKRLRPEWIATGKNREFVQRLRHDWGHTKAGFWSRVRTAPNIEAARIRSTGDTLLEAARKQSKMQRESQKDVDWDVRVPLTSLRARLEPATVGYDGGDVEPWRVNALTTMRFAFSLRKHPYQEWLDADVHTDRILSNSEKWNRFWLYEVHTGAMPRLWLRWAFEYLQLFHSVTKGTPGDAQLGTYLIDADIVISADRNFLRMVDMISNASLFRIAKTKLVPAGREGSEQTLEFLRRLS